MNNKTSINVTYYFRKPIQGYWSIEFIFKDLVNRLGSRIVPKIKVAKYVSSGLFKRLYNILEAPFFQSDINHITGDIHYISFLLAKRKTVLTVHDCGLLDRPSKLERAVLKLFWFTLPVKRVNYITCVSEFTRDQLIKHLPNFPKEKMVVIYNCVADNYVYRPKEFNKIQPRILHIGLAYNKNFFRLVQALENIPCTLVIIGRLDAAHIAALNKYHIQYEDHAGLTDAGVAEVYAGVDMLAFVSTSEGFGMPVIEANRTGRAVLTSKVTSLPEVAADAACYADPYDITSIRAGIQKIIHDDAYRNELIKKGLQNADRFNGEKIAGQYLSLYEQMLFKKM